MSPSGGKWWRFKYRYGGKEKRLSLGVYPDISLKVARERRDEARKQLANGVDPSEHRRAQKSPKQGKVANSLEVIAREWHAKYKPSWTEKHADTVIRRLEFNVFPWLGGKSNRRPRRSTDSSGDPAHRAKGCTGNSA
ncbi:MULTISPECIES: integrase arm-type DNA-binding domain-containing protein [unclassified Ectothiorhodospira]|uniref:tyrosine-type recombinase/integrase n=1 Tax=unclassified Ectothiorhodospira TaxID=2684909 RepID=UPI001EE96E0A|nr:Arm DNA-binding domain-containing protein [Ectothiorhodospira sp. 9100]MCG5519028.1 Arm DNA-binding domain-containing protein [Ectothiorhodospira sp. 9905]